MRKTDTPALGVGGFSTRMGWVGAVCSEKGLKGVSLPKPSLDDAIAECLAKSRQAVSKGQRHLLDAIVQGGTFLPPGTEKVANEIEKWLEELEAQVTAFYQGKNVCFDIPLDWSNLTPWQARVLKEVAKIPWGETRSYGWLAARLANSRGARAVGAAVARNPFPPVIPCHRVIQADGSLGGYGGGEELKQTLLQREGVVVSY